MKRLLMGMLFIAVGLTIWNLLFVHPGSLSEMATDLVVNVVFEFSVLVAALFISFGIGLLVAAFFERQGE